MRGRRQGSREAGKEGGRGEGVREGGKEGGRGKNLLARA